MLLLSTPDLPALLRGCGLLPTCALEVFWAGVRQRILIAHTEITQTDLHTSETNPAALDVRDKCDGEVGTEGKGERWVDEAFRNSRR